MTLGEVIKECLGAISGLKCNVYPAEGLKNASMPFVFYLQRAEEEEESLDGPTGLLSASFEINCVAKTYSGLVALARAVRQALQALQGAAYDGLLIERTTVRQASPDLKETEVNLYRRMYVLTVNYQNEEES